MTELERLCLQCSLSECRRGSAGCTETILARERNRTSRRKSYVKKHPHAVSREKQARANRAMRIYAEAMNAKR